VRECAARSGPAGAGRRRAVHGAEGAAAGRALEWRDGSGRVVR
jgi:hypothetical protein